MSALRDVAEELRGMVADVKAAAGGIAWHEPYGPDKWQRIEVLGHLVDSALNNLQRFVRAQLVERLEFPDYGAETFVAVQRYREYDAATVLALWESVNLHVAHVMEGIPEAKRGVPCKIGADPERTLEWLVRDYNVHFRGHLEDILP